jgi:hypothetical protein
LHRPKLRVRIFLPYGIRDKLAEMCGQSLEEKIMKISCRSQDFKALNRVAPNSTGACRSFAVCFDKYDLELRK